MHRRLASAAGLCGHGAGTPCQLPGTLPGTATQGPQAAGQGGARVFTSWLHFVVAFLCSGFLMQWLSYAAALALHIEHNIRPPLAQVPGLVDQLAELSGKGCRVGRLLELLVAVAMDQLAKHPHYEQLLQTMLARVQMGELEVGLLTAGQRHHRALPCAARQCEA